MSRILYRVPLFPSVVAVWHSPNVPPAGPDVLFNCQLTPGRRAITPYVIHPAGSVIPGVIHALLPKGADIRDAKAASGPDLVECPVGSGRFYDVTFVDDIGLGFTNEHRFAQLRGIPTWPTPFPTSRYPEGVTAIPLGSGTSAGVPVVNLLFNVVIPFPGVLFIVVADYNSAAGGCAAFVTSGTTFPAFQSPIVAAVGQTAFTAIFPFPVAAGYYNAGVKVIFGLDVFQYQLILVTGITAATLDVSAGLVGAGIPFIPGVAGQTVPVEMNFAPFARVGALGASAYGMGFINTGFDVTDVIGGQVCTLSCGTLSATAIGLYPVNIPLAVDAGWSGMNVGFR